MTYDPDRPDAHKGIAKPVRIRDKPPIGQQQKPPPPPAPPPPPPPKHSPMPTIQRWANDLRSVFGVADMDSAMRQYGYYASEAGRVVDTRKPVQYREFTPITPCKPLKPARK